MLFNLTLGIPEVNRNEVKVNHREAVRAVVFKDNEILMVLTNKGDYKFPGGGIENNESHEEALIREVSEETGYLISGVKERVGIVTERNMDEFEKDSIFEMTSYYYHCEVTEAQVAQQLDYYEYELGFRPKWINIDAVISNNEDILNSKNASMNRWVQREISVLHVLRKL